MIMPAKLAGRDDSNNAYPDLGGKKLLLLAGADPHRKVVEAAHELGVYVIVADYYDDELDAPAKTIADEAWLVDVMDVEELARRYEEAGDIDGILNFCLDAPQMSYARLCERFGLPCYGTPEQFRVLSDKAAFKEYCQGHGLLTIPSYCEEEALKGNINFPVFVKPVDSRGSRGQSICHSLEELPAALDYAKKYSLDGRALIEKYMGDMQDFTISCLISNGIPYVIKMGDRYDGAKKDGMDRQHILTISPSVDFDLVFEKTYPRIVRFIEDLGIRFGALFLQGFMEDGEVYCYDPGLRLPGSDFDRITKDLTGFDPMKSAIIFALTGDETALYGNPEDMVKLNGKIGIMLSLAARPGVIKKIVGLEDVLKDPRTHGISIRHKEGDYIPETGDTNQRIVEYVASFDSAEELPGFFDFVYKTVSVEDEDGDEMLISKAHYEDGMIDVR